MKLIDNLKITWGVLFVGLKNNWLTPHEVVRLVNEYSAKLTCNEDLLVELNVNEDDRNMILSLIEEKGELEEEQAMKYWQKGALLAIRQSKKPIKEKLRDIELQWSRFDYPEEWKDFIYYMPNTKSDSSEEIYQIFLNYVNNASNSREKVYPSST
jgi:hypothetical protein